MLIMSDRTSADENHAEEQHFFGYVKIRLGHSERGSILIPDTIFIKSGAWRFFQPSFFGPPVFSFNVEPSLDFVTFSVDVGSPRADKMKRLILHIRSDELERRYADGAMLYRCLVHGSGNFSQISSGRCLQMPSGEFCVRVFHHTDKKGFAGISSSGEIWSSSWNLRGTTHKLTNVAYAYFTTIPKIKNERDLHRIAMSSNGFIHMTTTSIVPKTFSIEIRRKNTRERLIPIEVNIPVSMISPPHILYHPFVSPTPAYYEVVCPEIIRVGLHPGNDLKVCHGLAENPGGALKSFEYIVMGDASEQAGLAAPFDEEETKQIMHLERFSDGSTPFQFWKEHQNSDQVTGRDPELRHVSKVIVEDKSADRA